MTSLVDYEAFCGAHAEPGRNDLPRVSPEDYARRRSAGEAGVLLDVRDPHERAIAGIPGARPIALAELPARLHELDTAVPVTLCCHRGERSVEAYLLLYRAGFRRLEILDGGVDAWAERVDSAMPRY